MWKVNAWYQWIIQCNTDSCCWHMTCGGGIYLYGCVSLLVPVCAGYLCVYVRVIKSDYHQKTKLCVRPLDVNLMTCCIKPQARSGTKVTTLDIYRSIIWLSEITHQMWLNHRLSQRNETSKIAVELKVGGNGKERLDKIFKSWGRFGALCQLSLIKSCSNSLGKILEETCKRVYF